MITELVPCGNPRIKELVGTQSRSVRTWDNFKPHEIDGVKICAWCWVKPFKHPRQKYCSDECRESCNLFCYPQTNAGLAYLFTIRGPQCESCGYSWKENLNAMRAKRIRDLQSFIETSEAWRKVNTSWAKQQALRLERGEITHCMADRLKGNVSGDRRPEIDHIIPVALGGTTLGFENLQLLCSECHKQKTRNDMIEIRESRRKKS